MQTVSLYTIISSIFLVFFVFFWRIKTFPQLLNCIIRTHLFGFLFSSILKYVTASSPFLWRNILNNFCVTVLNVFFHWVAIWNIASKFTLISVVVNFDLTSLIIFSLHSVQYNTMPYFLKFEIPLGSRHLSQSCHVEIFQYASILLTYP